MTPAAITTIAVMFLWDGAEPRPVITYADPEQCWQDAARAAADGYAVECRIATLASPIGLTPSGAAPLAHSPRPLPKPERGHQ